MMVLNIFLYVGIQILSDIMFINLEDVLKLIIVYLFKINYVNMHFIQHLLHLLVFQY